MASKTIVYRRGINKHKKLDLLELGTEPKEGIYFCSRREPPSPITLPPAVSSPGAAWEEGDYQFEGQREEGKVSVEALKKDEITKKDKLTR